MRRIFALVLVFALSALSLQASQIKHIRSLNAATSVTNGGSFDGAVNPLPPQGGGSQWNVVVVGTGGTLNITFQVQVKMTDGTWAPIYTYNLTSANPQQSVNFQAFGPFADMRVAITSFGNGSLTADIFVMF